VKTERRKKMLKQGNDILIRDHFRTVLSEKRASMSRRAPQGANGRSSLRSRDRNALSLARYFRVTSFLPLLPLFLLPLARSISPSYGRLCAFADASNFARALFVSWNSSLLVRDAALESGFRKAPSSKIEVLVLVTTDLQILIARDA